MHMIRHDATSLDPDEGITLLKILQGLSDGEADDGWYSDRRPVMIAWYSLH